MLQRDYFMKMTQMLAAVLAKVLFHKEVKEYGNAESEIEAAAKTIVGIDLKLFSLLSIEDILKLLKTSDIYAGRSLITAELLKEYADILELQNNKFTDLYSKSLELYLEALSTKELPAPEDYFFSINKVITKLSDFNFSNDLKYKLLEYYEQSGQYSRAEDILFELLEEQHNLIHDKAVSFYTMLKSKTNDELIKGNLSRQEVEEGLEEVYKLKQT